MWTWWDDLKTMAFIAMSVLALGVAIGGFLTLLAPHEPSCPTPAHVEGSRS